MIQSQFDIVLVLPKLLLLNLQHEKCNYYILIILKESTAEGERLYQ